MRLMIVMKFGGSSLESATALQNVVSIVNSFRAEKPVVVVSAMGKTTDRLLQIGALAAAGKFPSALLKLHALEQFHTEQLPAAQTACLFEDAAEVVHRISVARELNPRLSDELLSYGERLSSQIVAQALGAVHLKSQALIVTNNKHTCAAPLLDETYAKLRRAIPLNEVSVIGGFIGATESGVPTTLGRGGSDFTAALVGAAINAEEIQIWTDVNGMLSCDPRVTPGGRCLRSISYSEAFEMADWGAKVLHPATVAPAVRQRVPLSIRNSRNANHPGTLIAAVQPARREGLVKSIACLKNVTLLRIHNATASVQPYFQKHQVPFHAMNGRRAIEIAVSNCPQLETLIEDLSQIARVEVERNLAAVSLIGKGIDQNQGLLSHAIKTLANRSVPFHSLGTNALRVTFLVAEQELAQTTEGLHDEFVKFQENGPFYRDFETQRARQKEPRLARTFSPAYC
jgi:aspartate kinase